MVECSGDHLLRSRPHHRVEACRQLPRCPSSEGHYQDSTRVHALADQKGGPGYDGSGLARTGSSQDQRMALSELNCCALLIVKFEGRFAAFIAVFVLYFVKEDAGLNYLIEIITIEC